VITSILSDFSRVVLKPKDDNYNGTLNGLYKELKSKSELFNFYDYFELNNQLLDLYKQLKKKYSINLFTTGSIQNAPEIKDKIYSVFEHVFSAEELGLDKKDPKSYMVIAENIHLSPDQIFYIDDQQENIEAAIKAGLFACLYENNQKLFKNLKNKIREF